MEKSKEPNSSSLRALNPRVLHRFVYARWLFKILQSDSAEYHFFSQPFSKFSWKNLCQTANIAQRHVRLRSLPHNPPPPCLPGLQHWLHAGSRFSRGFPPRHILKYASAQDQFAVWVWCPPARLLTTFRTLIFLDLLASRSKNDIHLKCSPRTSP